MITVIIAGGSGSRLWPLSTPDFPKHLLPLTGKHTLIQHTYRRAKTISDEIYVLTEASHAHHVKEQLPELSEDVFIIEPARRGTASCIISALRQLSMENKTDEPVAFLHADHYIRNTEGFTHTFKVAETTAKASKRIVLVGVEPDYPATGFGYIQKDGLYDEETFVHNVHSFKEKPPFETARDYMESGNYLWNCGYFVGTLETFLNEMRESSPELYESYEKLLNTGSAEEYTSTYMELKNEAIDYALLEKSKDLLVVPASFDWMDLGSYLDVHKAVISDEAGNHLNGQRIETEETENSFIHSTEDKPVAVIGLDNVVIVNTPHGLLVTRKDLSQKVGDISKRFNNKEG